MIRRALLCMLGSLGALPLRAQTVPAGSGDSIFVRVRVRADSATNAEGVAGVIVRSAASATRTDNGGLATLRLAAGAHTIVATRLGYRPDSAFVVLHSDTTVLFVLLPQAVVADAMIVTSTRGGRRVEDTPIRVEVIDEEEVAEKVAMAPGDIGMMLNETSGLRVQSTNPSLGGANVRIQGLNGRYSLILADGLPLYGGQTGGLGLLQIPPVDLGRVEIIKGTASALYGSSALGGVIDLISRKPSEKVERTLLVNGTSRAGTDALFFGSGSVGKYGGATLLAGAHQQKQNDIDGDGWTDMPGYERIVVRPRLYVDDRKGRSAFVTAGFTAESRHGGTMSGRIAPDGLPYAQSLRTRRGDVGALARWLIQNDGVLAGSVLTLRASAVEQRHAHQFGIVREDDRHRTWFGETSVAMPKGAITYVGGVAFQQESYRSNQVARFDYTYAIPSAFVQIDADVRPWLSLSGSARADAHSKYGTFVNPRVSLLLRAPGTLLEGWTARMSGGTGAFAPTPFVEESEVIGLTPFFQFADLVAERARSASADIGGPLQFGWGRLEVNGTLFGSTVAHPLHVVAGGTVTPEGVPGLTLINAPEATRTWGAEALVRAVRKLGGADEAPVLRITGTYTFLRSRECSASTISAVVAAHAGCPRNEVALTPRHSAGVVATVEQEGVSRVGLELYYTGRQRLENNPFRSESRPYLIVGLMGEHAFKTRAGTPRFFLNLENLTNVRQTRYDPLLLARRGEGGRWTTDAWTDLTGFTVNGGVRFVW